MDTALQAALAPWVDVTDAEVTEAVDAIVDEVLRPWLLGGAVDQEALADDVAEAAADAGGPLDDVADDRAFAAALVRHVWVELHQRCGPWAGVETDGDRLERAFDALDAAGVGTGWFTDAASVERVDGDHGIALTSHHDLARLAVDEDVVLRVEFGSLLDTDDDAAVGREVVGALQAEGFRPEWDGEPGRAIAVTLRWRPHVPPAPEPT